MVAYCVDVGKSLPHVLSLRSDTAWMGGCEYLMELIQQEWEKTSSTMQDWSHTFLDTVRFNRVTRSGKEGGDLWRIG